MNFPIDVVLEELESLRTRVIAWRYDEAIAVELAEKYPNIVTRVSCGYQRWELQGILIHAVGINMEQLKPIFQFLGKHGYVHNGIPGINGDLKRVVWDFGNIKLLVFFDTRAESACRFVPTKAITGMEYEFICPDSNFNEPKLIGGDNETSSY